MSDQSPLHKTFTRLLLGGILIVMVLGLVLTGNSDLLRSGVGNRNIAKIGDKTITAQEFEMIYARRIAQSGLTDANARQMGVPSMVLQKEIERQTLLQAAKKLGIRIDNKYVASQLKKQLDQLTLSGTPQEKLQMVLQQQKITERELVDLLRGDFAINVLASTASTGDLQVPDELVKSSYQSGKEKRSAEIIAVTSAKAKPLSKEQINSYYKENGERYRTLEQRDIAVLVLPKELFSKDVVISDEDAKTYYTGNTDKFMAPERVKLEQVIVNTKEAADKIIAAKPASLEALKEKQSLKSDWYAKSSLPKEFETALYPAQPKGLVGPVKTSLGWHVMNVTEYQKAKPLSFEESQAVIKRQLKDDKLDAQMTEFTNDLDNAIAEEASLEAIGKKYKLKPLIVPGVTVKGALDNLALPEASKQRIQEAAFSLQDDEISPLLDTSDGDYLLVQVTKIDAAHIPELKEILPVVTADAEKANQSKALLNKAEELVGLFDPKDPTAFVKAIKDAGLTGKVIPAQTKEEMTKAYDADLAELVFTLGANNTLSYTQEAGKISLIRLKDIQPNSETPDVKTSDTLRETVKNDMIQELQQQFMAAWQKDLHVSVNMDLLQSAFGPQAKE